MDEAIIINVALFRKALWAIDAVNLQVHSSILSLNPITEA